MTRDLRPLVLLAALAPGAAAAQPAEVPVLVLEGRDEPPAVPDDLVVVEDPLEGRLGATVFSAEELAEQPAARDVIDVVGRLPGWLRVSAAGGADVRLVARGLPAGAAVIRDGLLLVDPVLGLSGLHLAPASFKRLESGLGPGGYRGAQSVAGALVLVARDAEDAAGVAAALTLGDGPGDPAAVRGRASYGHAFARRGGVYVEASFESGGGAVATGPTILAAPLPGGLPSDFLVGAAAESDPARSFYGSIDGKASWGDATLAWSLPLGHRPLGLGLLGTPLRVDLPEDTAVLPDGTRACAVAVAGTAGDACADPGRSFRESVVDVYDRFLTAELRRAVGARAQLSGRVFAVQFVRRADPLLALAPIADAQEGGVGWSLDLSSFRAGAAVDGAFRPRATLQLDGGLVGYHDWLGAAAASTLDGRTTTTLDAAARTTLGAWAGARFRPLRQLVLEGGASLQAILGGVGDAASQILPVLSCAAALEPAPGYRLRVDVAQAARPAGLLALYGQGDLVAHGDAALGPEETVAVGLEATGRFLRGRRAVRGLEATARYVYTRADGVSHAAADGVVAGVGALATVSAGASVRLTLRGGHVFELGGTNLAGVSAELGPSRGLPERWLSVGARLALLPGRLDASAGLLVVGAFEAPRLVVPDGLSVDGAGNASPWDPRQTAWLDAGDVALVREPAAADLTLSLRYRARGGLEIAVAAANVFDSRRASPLPLLDASARAQPVALPGDGLRLLTTLTYRH